MVRANSCRLIAMPLYIHNLHKICKRMKSISCLFLISIFTFPIYGKECWAYRPLQTDGAVYTNKSSCFCARATDFDVIEIDQRGTVFTDKMRSRVYVDDSSIIVVGDVLSVDIVALSGFDVNRVLSDCPWKAWGVYRIDFLVRQVEKGSFSLRRFLFLARCDNKNVFAREENRWLFYRGMTLRLGLNQRRRDSVDGLAIVGALPCVPYAPFSPAQIVDPESDDVPYFKKIIVDRKEATGDVRFPRLILRYNADDTVMFVSSRSITQFPYQPVFDYNAYSRLYVRASEGSPAYDYWKYSWLAEPSLGGESKVVFLNLQTVSPVINEHE